MLDHVLIAGIVLIIIEALLLLVFHLGTATQERRAALEAAQDDRRHPLWMLIYIGYHIPILALVTLLRRDDRAPWWLFAPLTVVCYLIVYITVSNAMTGLLH